MATASLPEAPRVRRLVLHRHRRKVGRVKRRALLSARSEGITTAIRGALGEASMVWVRHMGRMLPLLLLSNSIQLSPHLLNLLLELVVFGEKGTVRFISSRHIPLVRKQLADDLIHNLVIRADLRCFVLLHDIPPIHIFKLITDVALSDDTLKDLNPVSQFSVFIRQMEVLVLAPLASVSKFVHVRPKITISLHKFLGEVDRLNHSVRQSFGIKSVEHGTALAFRLASTSGNFRCHLRLDLVLLGAHRLL